MMERPISAKPQAYVIEEARVLASNRLALGSILFGLLTGEDKDISEISSECIQCELSAEIEALMDCVAYYATNTEGSLEHQGTLTTALSAIRDLMGFNNMVSSCVVLANAKE